MIRRPRRSIPAVVVGVLLLALSVLVVVAGVQSLIGGVPVVSLEQVLAATSARRWTSPATVATAIVAALLGLVLLVAAVRPGTPTVMPLGRRRAPDGGHGHDAGVRRRTYACDLRSAVAEVPGVTRARVTVSRTTVTARVRVAAVDPAGVRDRIRERIDERVLVIGPAFRPRVRVRARRADTS